ncbi:hydrogenase maturation protease [Sulfurimonas sp.]|jgi:hydrogenase maturation protease|uniref:hydrogenase maturation protease n=1 Tax=Sulfurimonas sp. TaxID=2022749 RepID=UPI0025FC3D4B|nr:hydrogenase maturation protease [Sulfurimonas sp.]MBT5935673.1 hydrogenase maturation protease [Sulfurimonas sp.]
MNKKQFAILSAGNVLQKDEGIALYATKYLETNYSFNPSVDIIHGGIEGMNVLNILVRYEEVFVLDLIGVDDDAGSLYNLPMAKFRSLGANESADETNVLECLNMLERRGETLPEVSLLAIVPGNMDKEIGLSPALHHSFEAYMLMLIKTLEGKGITCDPIDEKKTLDSVIDSFKK